MKHGVLWLVLVFVALDVSLVVVPQDAVASTASEVLSAVDGSDRSDGTKSRVLSAGGAGGAAALNGSAKYRIAKFWSIQRHATSTEPRRLSQPSPAAQSEDPH